jgi:hypothetical protein
MWIGASAATDTAVDVPMKEPLYGTMIWVMNRLLSGNEYAFKFSISFINYILLTTSMALFGRRFAKIPNWLAISGILIMCFIPYVFTVSLQLIRQFLAEAIIIYVLIRKSLLGKRCWLWIAAATLIHSTAWLFVPLLFFKAYDEPIKNNVKYYLLLIIMLVAVKLLSLGGGGEFSDGTLGYAASRAASNKFSNEEAQFSVLSILMYVIVYLFALFLIFYSKLKTIKGLRRICLYAIFTLSFAFVNMDNPFLAGRYLGYLYSLIPFMIILFFYLLNVSRVFVILFTFGCVVAFALYTEYGIWDYNIPYGVWLTPLPSYFLN